MMVDVAKALIVDDEEDICELIALSFSSIGISCCEAYSVSDAMVALKREHFDVCITDLRLPDGDGLHLISYIQMHYPDLPVAMMTAHGNVESAVEALKRGAFDFVSKPFDLDTLRNMALSAIKTSREPQSSAQSKQMLGDSPAMQTVRSLIAKFARSQAPVLINGESGTGKELAARAIHASSPRAEGAFIAVNCGAIPEHLVESEFFGHKKGSFTGADKDKPGLFQAAQGGTLFLDEVADLPHAMQVKLLRAIQERSVRPVGATEEMQIDVRFISATHRNLQAMVVDNTFRQDLYYRLNVIALQLPALRERLEDLPALCVHILARINKTNGANVRITPEAIMVLKTYQFPGNVRELENLLERACALCNDDKIRAEDLNLGSFCHSMDIVPSQLTQAVPVVHQQAEPDQSFKESPHHVALVTPVIATNMIETNNLEQYLEDIERVVIHTALQATKNNKTQAAERLGISFRQLRYRLKKLGMDRDSEDAESLP